MKNTIIILLITGLLSSTFSKLILFSNYIVNKEYITNKFCENKLKPKLKCNGKCHLSKQLKEQDKQEGQSKNTPKEVNEIQLFSGDPELQLALPSACLPISNLEYLQKAVINVSNTFFHPPTC